MPSPSVSGCLLNYLHGCFVHFILNSHTDLLNAHPHPGRQRGGRCGCVKVSRWQQAGAGQRSPSSQTPNLLESNQPYLSSSCGVSASQAVCRLLDKSINCWLGQLGLWSVLLKFRLREALPELEPGCSCTAQHSLVFSAVSWGAGSWGNMWSQAPPASLNCIQEWKKTCEYKNITKWFM